LTPWLTTILASGISGVLVAAVSGMLMHRVQRRLNLRDEKEDKRDEARKQNELLLIQATGAAIALGKATAISVQRIDPQCNGDMKEALEYADKIKHKQEDFLREQSMDNIY